MKVTLLDAIAYRNIGSFECEIEPVKGNIVVLPDTTAFEIVRKVKILDNGDLRLYGRRLGKRALIEGVAIKLAVHRLKYDSRELMLAWRYAVSAFLWEAFNKNVLSSCLSGESLRTMLETQHRREWNIFISRNSSKAYRWKVHTPTANRPTSSEAVWR